MAEVEVVEIEEEEEEEQTTETLRPSFPLGRVKKIMKLDQDINKITSEALFLISLSTDLFLQFLAEKSSVIATENKKKIIKLEHMRIAVKRHQPTNDFLYDSLPMPSSSSSSSIRSSTAQKRSREKSPQVGNRTRRIDNYFSKSANETN